MTVHFRFTAFGICLLLAACAETPLHTRSPAEAAEEVAQDVHDADPYAPPTSPDESVEGPDEATADDTNSEATPISGRQ